MNKFENLNDYLHINLTSDRDYYEFIDKYDSSRETERESLISDEGLEKVYDVTGSATYYMSRSSHVITWHGIERAYFYEEDGEIYDDYSTIEIVPDWVEVDGRRFVLED